jgi:hypothetical protein
MSITCSRSIHDGGHAKTLATSGLRRSRASNHAAGPLMTALGSLMNLLSMCPPGACILVPRWFGSGGESISGCFLAQVSGEETAERHRGGDIVGHFLRGVDFVKH